MSLIDKLSRTKSYQWIAKNILAKVTFRIWPRKPFDENTLTSLLNVLAMDAKENEILCFVSQDRWALGSILIRLVSKSKWSHAGFLIDSRRVDMNTNGLDYRLPSSLFNYDLLSVVKIPIKDKQACRKRLQDYFARRASISYDWKKELENENTEPEAEDIYCSELVWLVLKGQADLKCSTVLGRKVFSPDDVAKSGKVIWSYK
jgi:hypothetical protein